MEQKNVNRTKRIVLGIIAVFLSVLVIGFVAIRLIFPQHDPLPTTGEFGVESVLYSYVDENRTERYSTTDKNRKVNVEFWYPENADSVYPLVIFSHGALGIRSSNLLLYRELASHGYVVGAVDHPYQAFWTRDVDGQLTLINLGYLSDLQREDAKTDTAQSFSYYQDWMEIRMGDINFILETVFQNAENDHFGVFSLVDTGKIGVMGHSLGGSAALGIGRQRDDVKAVIALEAPFLYDIEGVENGAFLFINEVYPTPVLNIYSDDSWENLSEWGQYARNYALLSDTEATAFNMHINGVGHLALTDLALSSPFLVGMLDRSPMARDSVEVLNIINRLSLDFFDQFLKGEGEFSGFQIESVDLIP